MHTKTIQKIQKAYIKTYEEDVKIYKDLEKPQGQVAFFLKTPVCPKMQFLWPPLFGNNMAYIYGCCTTYVDRTSGPCLPP